MEPIQVLVIKMIFIIAIKALCFVNHCLVNLLHESNYHFEAYSNCVAFE